jgi:threonine/homoserine/homoserine lactone efflux protein
LIMKELKNILVGFIVSFLGSLPLGYLNIVGFQIYQKSGIESVVFYLFGIIFIEIFVIYFTLIFANRLSENQKLMKYIEFFSIIFLFLLAYIFHHQSENHSDSNQFLSKYLQYSAFSIGVIGNCFNFMQLPFWASWNLYLINNKYITTEKSSKYFFVFGTTIGIFFGMLSIILGLNQLSINSEFLSKWILTIIIPLFFVAMAVFQSYKFYKKYLVSKN